VNPDGSTPAATPTTVTLSIAAEGDDEDGG
jgi:hypothetical protein